MVINLKLLVVFETKKLPRHFHFMFSSIVKAALEVSNPQYQKALYQFTEEKANKTQKPFTGAIKLENYSLENEEFLLNGNVRLIISSSDAEFMLNLYNGFVQKRKYQFKSYELTVSHIKMLPEKLPNTQRALFKTLSPIIIRDRDGKFLGLEDSNYQRELNYISNECIKALEKRELYEPLKFTPIVMHKKVIQLKHDAFKNLNAQHILYMNAYEGSFVLEGDSRDLALLTQAGLGFRRSTFFGCIELINE